MENSTKQQIPIPTKPPQQQTTHITKKKSKPLEKISQTNITKYLTTTTLDLHKTNFLPVTLREFDATLNTFKYKDPVPSGITALQIKHIPQNMKLYLLYIINNAISVGYFFWITNHSHTILIPKPGLQYIIRNYGPISRLEIHGKILGKTLDYRLVGHLTMHDTIKIRQHLFRINRCTLATLYATIFTRH